MFAWSSLTYVRAVCSCRYFSHLFGHESGGSILAALKTKSWASNLASYQSQVGEEQEYLHRHSVIEGCNLLYAESERF
jgi:hypothetical protein